MYFTSEHEFWLGYVKRYMDKMETVGRLLLDFPDVVEILTLEGTAIYEAKVAVATKWVDEYWERDLHVLTSDLLTEELRKSLLSLDDSSVEVYANRWIVVEIAVVSYEWGPTVLKEFGHLLPTPVSGFY